TARDGSISNLGFTASAYGYTFDQGTFTLGDRANISDQLKVLNFTPIPQKPRLAKPAISSASATANAITVNWAKVSHANGYSIFYSEQSNFATGAETTRKVAFGSNVNSGTISGLILGRTYYFKVVATANADNSYQDSEPSAEQSQTTLKGKAAAPGSVILSEVFASSVKVSWTVPSDAAGIAGYTVSWGASSEASENTQDVSDAGATGYTIRNALPVRGTKIYVKVKSKASSGYSDSDWVLAAAAVIPTKLATPRNVRTTQTELNALGIGWTSVANAAGYTIFYATTSTGLDTIDNNTSRIEVSGGGASSGKIINLNANTTYYFRVMAKAAAGSPDKNSDLSAQQAATTSRQIKLSAPASVKATVSSSTAITVSWGAVPNAQNYEIVYSGSSAFSSPQTVRATGSGHSVSSLQSGTNYYFKVIAKAALNSNYQDSDSSAVVSAGTKVAAPNAVSLGAVKTTSVVVNWQPPANTKGISGYTVSWGADSDADDYTHDVAANANTYKIIANLPGIGSSLYIKVRAKGSSVATSSSWTILSSGGGSVNIPSRTALKTPANITASSVATTSAALAWDRVQNAVGYEIYYSTSSNFTPPAAGTKVPVSGGAKAAHTVSGLTSATTYYFKVLAKAAANGDYADSPASANVSATTKVAAPGTLIVSNSTPTTIGLTWTMPATTGVAGYRVEWGNSGSNYAYNATVNGAGNKAYTINSNLPAAGQTLYIRVRAEGGSGQSAWTTATSVILAKSKLSTPLSKPTARCRLPPEPEYIKSGQQQAGCY
ncbi:MAG: fibronectin type III domain-containing protein, partial [Spirochaetota bacterium]